MNPRLSAPDDTPKNIHQALEHLSHHHRLVIELRDGLKPFSTPMAVEDVADKTGMTAHRVTEIEREARARLAELLPQRAEESESEPEPATPEAPQMEPPIPPSKALSEISNLKSESCRAKKPKPPAPTEKPGVPLCCKCDRPAKQYKSGDYGIHCEEHAAEAARKQRERRHRHDDSRSPFSSTEPRDRVIAVDRMTTTEKALIQEAAARSGLDLLTWCRTVLLESALKTNKPDAT